MKKKKKILLDFPLLRATPEKEKARETKGTMDSPTNSQQTGIHLFIYFASAFLFLFFFPNLIYWEAKRTWSNQISLMGVFGFCWSVSDDEEIDYSVKPEFYDPELDDKDELWAHKKRKGRTSDAVLSCPACFTTLSLDCQRFTFIFSIII